MELQENVYTAQLDKITYPTISAHLEDGRQLTIETNQKQRNDPQFWAVISAILKADLWVPVSRRLHQLMDTDWLMPETPLA